MIDLEKKEKVKEYMKIYSKKYRLENKDKLQKYRLDNKEEIKKYRLDNKIKKKEYDKQYRKKYYEENIEEIQKYRLDNKIKINQNDNIYRKNRRQIDPLFKLTMNIRSLIGLSIRKQNYSKQSKTFEILGCTYEDFKQHLERQFKKGMTWENSGSWHLDHIIPVSLAKDEQDIVKLNHYTNFQPLWAADNLLKGNKVIANTQIKLV